MLDFWTDLPSRLRIAVALIIFALGGVIFWFISVRLGIGIAAMGFVMFLIGGKSDAERNGYNF